MVFQAVKSRCPAVCVHEPRLSQRMLGMPGISTHGMPDSDCASRSEHSQRQTPGRPSSG